MAVISKGQTFATGDQVTALKLNNLADNATFASGAVDNVSTQLSGGAIVVKDGGVTTAKLNDGAVTVAKLDIDALYPVGSIYMNASDSTNPSTLLGFGTWVAFGAGKVPVGIDASDTDFDTAEETGGAKTHVLTKAQIPPHTHTYNRSALNINADNTGNRAGPLTPDTTSAGDVGENENGTGNAEAHNNLQPYIVVHMWKRTA